MHSYTVSLTDTVDMETQILWEISTTGFRSRIKWLNLSIELTYMSFILMEDTWSTNFPTFLFEQLERNITDESCRHVNYP